MLRYLLPSFLSLSHLLLGCQQAQQSPARTRSVSRSSVEPLAGVSLPAAAQPAASVQMAVPQTLYPDTLRPRALAYRRWTTAGVDTMAGRWLPVADARYRVLDVHGTPAYEDGPYLRLFCRNSNVAVPWLELDLRNPLSEFATDLYLQPQAIELDHHPPAELLVRAGGRNDGNSSGTGLGYTLLLLLAPTPTVVW